MKKLNFLFVVLTLIFASCSKDDAAPSIDTTPVSITEDNILGNWDLTEYKYSGPSFVGEAINLNSQIAINEPNVIISSGGNMTIKLTQTVDGVTQTTTQTVAPLSDGNWSLIGDKLTFTGPGIPLETTIVELTSSKLVLSFSQPVSFYTIDGSMVLNRI